MSLGLGEVLQTHTARPSVRAPTRLCTTSLRAHFLQESPKGRLLTPLHAGPLSGNELLRAKNTRHLEVCKENTKQTQPKSLPLRGFPSLLEKKQPLSQAHANPGPFACTFPSAWNAVSLVKSYSSFKVQLKCLGPSLLAPCSHLSFRGIYHSF